jgi:hypothetical protein
MAMVEGFRLVNQDLTSLRRFALSYAFLATSLFGARILLKSSFAMAAPVRPAKPSNT